MNSNRRNENTADFSRREWLQAACALAAGTICSRSAMAAEPAPSVTTLPALGSRPTTPPVSDTSKSIVVHLVAEEVLAGTKVHPSLAGEMVEEAIKSLTQREKPADAWHAVLQSNDRIAIKFDPVGAETIGTTVPFGLQLVDSLGRAGFPAERIMLVDAPRELVKLARTRPQLHGWSGPQVDFGSGAERLSSWLQEVTAIINVPFLKTHNIAGMAGCLLNISHSIIGHPGRYYENGCSPFVGDIVALPQVRSRLRLHIVNALQVIMNGGPEARLEFMWPHHGIMVGKDPVALDSIGLEVLNERRLAAKLPPIGDSLGRLPYLHAAAQRGLGTDDQDYITLLEPRPF